MKFDGDAALTVAVLAVFLSAALLASWGVVETLRWFRRARRPRVGLPSWRKADWP